MHPSSSYPYPSLNVGAGVGVGMRLCGCCGCRADAPLHTRVLACSSAYLRFHSRCLVSHAPSSLALGLGLLHARVLPFHSGVHIVVSYMPCRTSPLRLGLPPSPRIAFPFSPRFPFSACFSLLRFRIRSEAGCADP
jgi:hypothetical protein